jgi:hypothetical protein
MSRFEEYKSRIFRKKGLNIENTARCTLLCGACKRTTFLKLNSKSFPGKDLTPEQFKKVVGHFEYITFGGQLSDPIFGVHFLELLKICHANNVRTRVLTAATGKPESFYKQAFEANPDAHWTFGIDGPGGRLSNNYRKNQDGEFLFDIMCMAKNLGIKVFWQYIIFPFNENYIEEAKQIANDLDISLFFIQSERD